MAEDAIHLLLQQIGSTQTAIQADLSAVRAGQAAANTSLEVIKATTGVADNMLRDHEARIRALERFRYTLAGAALIGGAAAGLIGALIEHLTR